MAYTATNQSNQFSLPAGKFYRRVGDEYLRGVVPDLDCSFGRHDFRDKIFGVSDSICWKPYFYYRGAPGAGGGWNEFEGLNESGALNLMSGNVLERTNVIHEINQNCSKTYFNVIKGGGPRYRWVVGKLGMRGERKSFGKGFTKRKSDLRK